MAGRLEAGALEAALAGLRFGRPLHFHAALGSTNDEAKRLAEAGAPEGLLVAADTQTAGRGRGARRWITAPGTALALSVVLRPALPPARATRLTMLAGVAVCEAVESTAGVSAALKWPNDVLLAGQKAGGILVETGLAGDRLDYAVVGIGLNVSQAPPRGTVDFPATDLESEAGRPVDRAALLRACLERLAAHYPDLAAEDGPLYSAWFGRLVWLGEAVTATTPEGTWHGRMTGADPDGALQVALDAGGTRRVLAGEVRLRLGEAHNQEASDVR
jgi:BirA family biotin operon repressor/biotin-[acetyl-CoA-carboxylase] ligase